MFDKIVKIIAAGRAGDWLTAVNLILDVVKEGLATFAPSPTPAVMALSEKGTDELLFQLEAMNNNPSAQAAGDTFKMFLPVLLALLQKFLGVA